MDNVEEKREEEEEVDLVYEENKAKLFKAIDDHKNVFLTGMAGTGKSFLIKNMVNEYKDKMKIYITSTSGTSAALIGGKTIHSFSGIGMSNSYDQAIARIKKLEDKKNKIKNTTNKGKGNEQIIDSIDQILDCDLLVIDEISMCGVGLLEILDKVFQYVRKTEGVPFGGIQVIFTGDFLQLPPVKDGWAFKSPIWDSLKLVPIVLKKVYRQLNDATYTEILSRIRVAKQIPSDNVVMFNRKRVYSEISSSLGEMDIKPTFLYSKNIDIDIKNKEELSLNTNKEVCLIANDGYSVKEEKGLYDQYLHMLAPYEITLKVGAQVMLRRNLDVKNGLCNGSRGIVVGFEYENPDNPNEVTSVNVKFRHPDGSTTFTNEIQRHSFEYAEIREVIDIETHRKVYKEVTLAVRNQFPLTLAYALTIHKSQGCSLDSAVVDLGNRVFGDHMVYVALSRVRNLQSLYILGYNPNKITVSQEVIEFLKSINAI